MRWLILDEWYPDAVAAAYRWRPDMRDMEPEEHRKTLLSFCHGTADYWERALVKSGHQAKTVVWNSPCGIGEFFDPDVVMVQNVGRWSAAEARNFAPVTVGMCSYRAEDHSLTGWDLVTTSFPHYMPRLESLGQKALFLPLAFDPVVLERTALQCYCPSSANEHLYIPAGPCPVHQPDKYDFRPFDVCFIGGLFHRHIWDKGTDAILEAAEQVPSFYLAGYGPSMESHGYRLNADWGRSYFRRLRESKVGLNRHGEIARGYSNNMRLFETTGCGACLVTEAAPNLADYFTPLKECIPYASASDLVTILKQFLDEDAAAEVAVAGQERCLREHTYDHRCEVLLDAVSKL